MLKIALFHDLAQKVFVSITDWKLKLEFYHWLGPLICFLIIKICIYSLVIGQKYKLVVHLKIIALFPFPFPPSQWHPWWHLWWLWWWRRKPGHCESSSWWNRNWNLWKGENSLFHNENSFCQCFFYFYLFFVHLCFLHVFQCVSEVYPLSSFKCLLTFLFSHFCLI